jgi:integrase
MACLTADSKGRRYIQLNELPGRPKVWLGEVPKKMAEGLLGKVEALLIAKASGQPLDHQIAVWVGEISRTPVSGPIYNRLVELGLLEASGMETVAVAIGDVFDRYINGRSKLKPNTLRNYQTTKRLLEEFFGAGRAIGTIHTGHARDYRELLIGKYSPATVAREIKRARQFFGYAKDCHLTDQNPFSKVKAGSQKNTKRKHFVSRDVIEKVLAACPDNNWRLVVVLARYGGLRIPSELERLTWSDVDWHGHKITIRVPKKEHIDGHETRIVPIFPEVKPYLRQAFDEAPDGSVHVLPKRFHKEGYVYAGVGRAAERAGVPKWPKLLVNLRASRETELMRSEPAHVVHAWLGNSREVAQDHYLMVTEADYERVTQDPSKIAVHFSVQSGPVMGLPSPSTEKESAVSPAIADYTADQIPPRGVERSSYPSGKRSPSQNHGADFGALGQEADELEGLVASLSPDQRHRLLVALKAWAEDHA